MNLRLFTAAVPVVVAATVGSSVCAGVAHADPSHATPDIHYRTRLVGDTVETTLDGGFFRISADHHTVDIADDSGRTVLTLPLSFRENGMEYPLPYQVDTDRRVLSLTATRNTAAARPVRAQPVASAIEDARALDAFKTQFGVATAIGTFVGTVIGGLIGLVGLVGGATVIASVTAGAGIGAVIGTIAVGGPALVVAGIDLLGTLLSAPGTSKWTH